MTSQRRVLGCLTFAQLLLGGCGAPKTGTECVARDHVACESGVLFWADSCGELGGTISTCECGCSGDGLQCRTPCDGVCTPRASAECDAALGTLFWLDSCGARGETKETCRCGCAADGKACGECVCSSSCEGRCGGSDGCEGTCPDTCDHLTETCDPETFTCIPCVAKTCVEQGYDCDDWDNGCGRVRSCGYCPKDQVCSQGVCGNGCTGGTTECDGSCVDLATDTLNCGSCGRECPSDRTCKDRDCVTSCAAGLTPCPDGCVDVTGDSANCGSCDRECLSDESCLGGDCVTECSGGLKACPDGCVDVTRDSANCGTCGRDCPSGQSCKGGDCAAASLTCPCSAGYYCDLGSNSCKAGCLADGDCSAGSICDNRTCRIGCRTDGACGSGKICQSTQCVTGCRADSACGTGNICEALTCRAGCRNNAGCPSNRICDLSTLQCKVECASDATCGSGKVCLDDRCRAGCRRASDCPGWKDGDVCSDQFQCVGRQGSGRCVFDSDCGATESCDGDTYRCVANAGKACTPAECWPDTGCAANEFCDPVKARCFPRASGARCYPGLTCGGSQACAEGLLTCVNIDCTGGRCGDTLMDCRINRPCYQAACYYEPSCGFYSGDDTGNYKFCDNEDRTECTVRCECSWPAKCPPLYVCKEKCVPYSEVACSVNADCGYPNLRCDLMVGRCRR